MTYFTTFSVKDKMELFKQESNETHTFLKASLYVRTQRGSATLDNIEYNISLISRLGATSTSSALVVPKYNIL